MKIGVMVDSFRMSLHDGIRKAAKLGADGLQMYAVSGDMAPEQLRGASRKELLDFIESLGLEVAAVCGDRGCVRCVEAAVDSGGAALEYGQQAAGPVDCVGRIRRDHRLPRC